MGIIQDLGIFSTPSIFGISIRLPKLSNFNTPGICDYLPEWPEMPGPAIFAIYAKNAGNAGIAENSQILDMYVEDMSMEGYMK